MGSGVEKDLMSAYTRAKRSVDNRHTEAKAELDIILNELEELTAVRSPFVRPRYPVMIHSVIARPS